MGLLQKVTAVRDAAPIYERASYYLQKDAPEAASLNSLCSKGGRADGILAG